jgi:hypothetical protein
MAAPITLPTELTDALTSVGIVCAGGIGPSRWA